MTTRIKAVVVTFAEDVREDDAECLMQSFRCFRNVADVSPVPADAIADYTTRTRLLIEVQDKLREMMRASLWRPDA